MLSQLGLQEKERRKLFPFRKRKGRSEGRKERRKERGSKEGGEEGGREGRRERGRKNGVEFGKQSWNRCCSPDTPLLFTLHLFTQNI